MEPIAQIGDYITLPNCETTGTVENIKEGSGDAIGQDPMSAMRLKQTRAGCAFQPIG